MKRITTKAHEFLLEYLNSSANICDLTCGNGNDTLFCAQHFKSVIAFDIQEEAILKSKEKCTGYTNIVFIQKSHELIDQYIYQKCDAFIFNGGYLPNSTSILITQTKSSLTAFEKAIQLLNKNGYLVFTFYRKHEGGNAEYEACSTWLNQQSTIKQILSYSYDDDELSPILLIFQRL